MPVFRGVESNNLPMKCPVCQAEMRLSENRDAAELRAPWPDEEPRMEMRQIYRKWVCDCHYTVSEICYRPSVKVMEHFGIFGRHEYRETLPQWILGGKSRETYPYQR